MVARDRARMRRRRNRPLVVGAYPDRRTGGHFAGICAVPALMHLRDAGLLDDAAPLDDLVGDELLRLLGRDNLGDGALLLEALAHRRIGDRSGHLLVDSRDDLL